MDTYEVSPSDVLATAQLAVRVPLAWTTNSVTSPGLVGLIFKTGAAAAILGSEISGHNVVTRIMISDTLLRSFAIRLTDFCRFDSSIFPFVFSGTYRET